MAVNASESALGRFRPEADHRPQRLSPFGLPYFPALTTFKIVHAEENSYGGQQEHPNNPGASQKPAQFTGLYRLEVKRPYVDTVLRAGLDIEHQRYRAMLCQIYSSKPQQNNTTIRQQLAGLDRQIAPAGRRRRACDATMECPSTAALGRQPSVSIRNYQARKVTDCHVSVNACFCRRRRPE